MQVCNDMMRIAERVDSLAASSSSSSSSGSKPTATSTTASGAIPLSRPRTATEPETAKPQGAGFDPLDTTRRLRESSSAIFEHHLEKQRVQLLAKLHEIDLEGMSDEALFKRSEKGLKRVERDLQNLGRVLKVRQGLCLPPTS